jgi:hypothetical protein
MICVECDNEKVLRPHVITKKYKECGLDNVTLHGVEEYRCAVCGAIYYKYGNLEVLHNLIAHILLKKAGLLRPAHADAPQFLIRYFLTASPVFITRDSFSFRHKS